MAGSEPQGLVGDGVYKLKGTWGRDVGSNATCYSGKGQPVDI